MAEYNISRAREILEKQGDLDQMNISLAKAIENKKYPSRYYFDYAQNLVVQSTLEARKEEPDLTRVKNITDLAISNINEGLAREKNFSFRYETAGDLYQGLRSALGYEANILAASVYEKAAALESLGRSSRPEQSAKT